MDAKKTVITAVFLAALSTAAPGICAPAEESLSHIGKLPPTKAEPLVWGKDPFVPAIKHVAAPDMRLKAIFYNPEKPSAIISDRIVYRGSTVDGQKVIEIGRTHVILQGESGILRLELAEIPELPNAGK